MKICHVNILKREQSPFTIEHRLVVILLNPRPKSIVRYISFVLIRIVFQENLPDLMIGESVVITMF